MPAHTGRGSAPMSFSNGLVTVGTTPTPICTVATPAGVTVQNMGTVAVFIGGGNVAASGANQGISVAPNAIVTLGTAGEDNETLYGIVATATQPVAYCFASLGVTS